MIAVWDLAPHTALLKGTKTKWSMRNPGIQTLVPVAATLENYPCHSKRLEWTPSSAVEVHISLMNFMIFTTTLNHHPTLPLVYGQRTFTDLEHKSSPSIVHRIRRLHDRMGRQIARGDARQYENSASANAYSSQAHV